MKICPMALNILPKVVSNFGHILHKPSPIFLPKWLNLAKSGRTDVNPLQDVNPCVVASSLHLSDYFFIKHSLGTFTNNEIEG